MFYNVTHGHLSTTPVTVWVWVRVSEMQSSPFTSYSKLWLLATTKVIKYEIIIKVRVRFLLPTELLS